MEVHAANGYIKVKDNLEDYQMQTLRQYRDDPKNAVNINDRYNFFFFFSNDFSDLAASIINHLRKQNSPRLDAITFAYVPLVARSHSAILHICSISLRCDPSWLFNGET